MQPCTTNNCFLGRPYISPPYLRAHLADCRETLPHDQKLAEFYNAGPKFGGHPFPQKNGGPKTCKILVDFIQPQTLIASISGTAQDIQNRKAN